MPSTSLLLSPAELSYLHTSLSSSSSSDTSATGIRPDGRHPTQFRPLIAEIDILPATNGSARVCFSDGTEAIVGVKGEVERTVGGGGVGGGSASDHGPRGLGADADTREDVDMGGVKKEERKILDKKWIELSIDIPGFKADDALPVFLSSMLVEALTATNELVERLWINSLWHWKLYVDILLISPPLSYPIPLLSITAHLALRTSRLPLLISEGSEDPMFNDDWDLSIPLYPSTSLPPITLLVILVGNNIYFDPSKEEVSVADVVLAISLGVTSTVSTGKEKVSGEEAETRGKRNFHLLAVRTIDPPSRLTMHGVPDRLNNATATGASASAGVLASAGVSASAGAMATAASKGTKGNMDIVQRGEEEGVWIPPRGGMKRGVVGRVLNLCVRENGVASEVLEGLDVFVSGSV